jgi:hypothetical protein
MAQQAQFKSFRRGQGVKLRCLGRSELSVQRNLQVSGLNTPMPLDVKHLLAPRDRSNPKMIPEAAATSLWLKRPRSAATAQYAGNSHVQAIQSASPLLAPLDPNVFANAVSLESIRGPTSKACRRTGPRQPHPRLRQQARAIGSYD